MKPTEIILLVCGSVLFLFSLLMAYLMFRRNEPFTKVIWFLVVSFLMMGFSVITEADVFGVFKYKKEKELSQVGVLTDALVECPENEVIKQELERKLASFQEHQQESEKAPEELEKIGNAFLVLGEEEKAISFSERILLSDTTNQTARTLKTVAQTQNLIKKIPNQGSSKEVSEQIQKNIDLLEKQPTVYKKQVDRIKHLYEDAVVKMEKNDSVPISN